jgi:hypothetical protein
MKCEGLNAMDPISVTRLPDGVTVIAVRGSLRLLPRLVVTGFFLFTSWIFYRTLAEQDWFGIGLGGGVAALFLVVTLSAWIGSSIITIDSEKLVIKYLPCVGFIGKHGEIPRQAVIKTSVVEMPGFGRRHYALWLKRHGGPAVCLANSIPRLDHAAISSGRTSTSRPG